MTAHDFLDIALGISLGILGLLVIIAIFGQICYYISIINENMRERRELKEEQKQREAQKIAKNIYGE